MAVTINPYEAIRAFGSFGGKCLATMDAVQALSDQDKHDLWRIMQRIGENASTLGFAAKSDEVRKDHHRVADAFEQAASRYFL